MVKAGRKAEKAKEGCEPKQQKAKGCEEPRMSECGPLVLEEFLGAKS
jgi:hypothetical protein